MIHPPSVNIAIVHRDGLYRDTLRYCLAQAEPEPISIVHSASRLDRGTWKTVVACRSDVLILEFDLCGGKRPGQYREEMMCASSKAIKTIVIGVPDTEEDILACLEGVGAARYLRMDARLDDLINNVHAIMSGEELCFSKFTSPPVDPLPTLDTGTNNGHSGNGICLTRREVEIVRLIEVGLSNKEIAARLAIELSTVKNHVHNILDKLQLHDRYSAIKRIKEQEILAHLY